MWLRKDGAFEAIVPSALFYTAQGIMRARFRRYSDSELLERLRELYQSRGFLSGLVINETEGMPSTSVYAHRFGSLIRAYQMVGFTPDRDYGYLEINRYLREMYPEVVSQTEQRIGELGGLVARDPATGILDINDEFSISIVLARCHTSEAGGRRWKIRFDTSLCPDITVAVRLDPNNRSALDYYLLPRLDFGRDRICLAESNAFELDSYRFETLDYLYGMAERFRIRRAA